MDISLTSPPIRSPQAVHDRLLALGASDPDDRPGFLRAFVFESARMGSLTGINWCWQVAQAAHETADPNPKTGTFGPFNSAIWRSRGNPGGIGVTDSVDLGYGFPDGIVAADAQHAHLYVYVKGNKDVHPAVKPELDPRWDAVIAKGWQGTVRTVDDLTGKWATDPKYGEKLRQRFTWVIEGAKVDASVSQPQPEEGTPVANTYGNVPTFGYVDRQFVTAGKPAGRGWDDLGKRDVLGVALHRMLGSLLGTDQHFRTANALTDYGIGVEATDGKGLAGVIYQWNDPFGRRSGWASGPVSKPYGDGKAFVDKYGVNAVNRRLVSIEISGQANTPVDAFAWGELVQFVAYWADRCKVPWETFPLNPATGFSFVLWHQEFTIGTGKECPFKWVMDNTDRLIADVKALLQKHQTGAVTPAPAPEPVPLPEPEIPEGFEPGAVVTATADLNMRWAPGTEFGVRAQMKDGEQAVILTPQAAATNAVPQVAGDYTWWPLGLGNPERYGWVAADWLELVSPAPKPQPNPEPTPSPEPTPEPVPVPEAGEVVTIYDNGRIVWHAPEGNVVIQEGSAAS